MPHSVPDQHRRHVLAEGKHLRLIQQGHWEYAERTKATSAVVIVAITSDERILLVEQFRIPIGKRVIELPAGLVGDTDGQETEDFIAAARRELLEETGYEAGEMHLATVGPPTSGLASEIVAFILASDLKQVAAGGGVDSEQIEVHQVDLAHVGRWLREQTARNLLVDPKVYAGLYFAEHPEET
jgi:ADP-ribose pyrophosphatase